MTTVSYYENGEWKMAEQKIYRNGAWELVEPGTITDGLLHWWKLDGDANDYAGNRDGTVNGATFESFGKVFDQSARATASGDNINFGPDSTGLTGDITICFWVYPEDFANGTRRNPIHKAYGGEFSTTWEDGAPDVNFYHGEAGSNSTPYTQNLWSEVAFNDDWVHVTYRRDNTAQTVELFTGGDSHENKHDTVNGNGWYSPTASTNDLLLLNGYMNVFLGYMQDVRIYDRVLSDEEVEKISNGNG